MPPSSSMCASIMMRGPVEPDLRDDRAHAVVTERRGGKRLHLGDHDRADGILCAGRSGGIGQAAAAGSPWRRAPAPGWKEQERRQAGRQRARGSLGMSAGYHRWAKLLAAAFLRDLAMRELATAAFCFSQTTCHLDRRGTALSSCGVERPLYSEVSGQRSQPQGNTVVSPLHCAALRSR